MPTGYYKRPNVAIRLLKRYKIVENDCWEFTGAKDSHGYGRIGYKNKVFSAHRLSFYLFKHRLFKGDCVLHKCDNPRCINPEHLFLGTQKENMLDCKTKRRHTWGQKSSLAKLSNDDIESIKYLVSLNKYSQYDLAFLFKITQSNISKIINGVSRKIG